MQESFLEATFDNASFVINLLHVLNARLLNCLHCFFLLLDIFEVFKDRSSELKLNRKVRTTWLIFLILLYLIFWQFCWKLSYLINFDGNICTSVLITSSSSSDMFHYSFWDRWIAKFFNIKISIMKNIVSVFLICLKNAHNYN